MHSTPMRIQLYHTWLHRKSSILWLLFCILLLASCSKEEIVVANVEHSINHVIDITSGQFYEHLLLSFDLLGESRPVQVRLASSNNVSSWLASVQGEGTASDTAQYQVGPLTMGEGIPLSSGIYNLTIINEDGIIRSEQLKLSAFPKEKLPVVIPQYESETGVLSSLPVPSQILRYDETGKLISTVSLRETSYTLQQEDASLAILADDITYLFQR